VDTGFEESGNAKRGESGGLKNHPTTEAREDPKGDRGNAQRRTGWVEPVTPYRAAVLKL
jgi:hypothetical protein